MIAIDGFPRTKEKGSTEILLQCLNLIGGINQNDFNRILALADLDETSPDMDKIVKHLNREVEALLRKSKDNKLQIEVRVPKENQGQKSAQNGSMRLRPLCILLIFFQSRFEICSACSWCHASQQHEQWLAC